MRATVCFLISFLLLLGGCLQSKEHLTINADGSGTLEVSQVMPEGTIKLIDSMLGDMMTAMTEALGGEEAAEQAPKSMAEEMLPNKEETLKIVKKLGPNAELVDFKKEMKNNNLHLYYKIKFDDINKLLQTEIIDYWNIVFTKDAQGNIVCFLKENPQKAKGLEIQKQQIEQWNQSDQAQQIDSAIRGKILDAMENLKIEIFITMPSEIKETSGVFGKKGLKTGYLGISGNLLEDPTILAKMAGVAEPSKVVWSGQGIQFELEEKALSMPSRVTREEEVSTVPMGSKVTVYMKDGTTVEGTLTEEGSEYIKVDTVGVPLTYYKDDIQRIEQIVP